ncbi:MAG TPA: NeuD/PglB/VioB family sugar acetyltransferase [Miltoncostaeaceae bacterium]|nr:NeuD/PglB/VioB family sugar acetyltransferase [Miltoncostaeaceae bacterium]
MISPPAPARPVRAHRPLPAAMPAPAGTLTPIVGVGAGGHAKSAIDAIESVFRFRVVALLDADPALAGTTVLGNPVLGGDALAALRAGGVEHAFVGLGGAGDTSARRAGGALLRDAGFVLPAIVHRTATVARSARLADGVQVLAGAIVGADSRLACDALVNAGAILGHDADVGEAAHVASGARLGGGVTVGAGAHVGTGAVVLQGRTIGTGAVVAAGAVVLEDVPDSGRVAGVPARPIRRGGAR